MFMAHLHLGGGYPPFRATKFNSAHSALRSSPGRTNSQGAQPQRLLDDEGSGIAFDSPQQVSDVLRIGQSGKVPISSRWQCAAQIARRITFSPSGRHGIAEYPPTGLQGAVCSFQSIPAFNPADDGQQFRRKDVL